MSTTSETAPPERLVVLVRGRVQGVGFRYATERRARALELTGYVRNEVDGSVLARQAARLGLPRSARGIGYRGTAPPGRLLRRVPPLQRHLLTTTGVEPVTQLADEME